MKLDLNRHIESRQGVRGGKPCLAGSRITVADVAMMHLRMAKSLDEIAGTYDLSLAAVHAALSYYYDNRQEIDRSIEDDIAYAEAFRNSNPSLLKKRLAELRVA
jgi:uncharacterized protein (DUF433 family)